MSVVVRSGMILAAGLGTRMRPLTDTTPKPMLHLAGRPLLDHTLDRLENAGIHRVVVNAHWHAEQIAARLAARAARDRPPLKAVLQREDSLLDTGGAVLEALRGGTLPDDGPFVVVNGDSYWLDGPVPALKRLAGAFDDAAHDAVLLVARGAGAVGGTGPGDFAIDEFGRLRRPREHELVPYLYAGVQLISPRLFEGIGHGAFGMNLLWDQAIGADRIRAVVHDGPWFHLSRPSDIADAERALRETVAGAGPATA